MSTDAALAEEPILKFFAFAHLPEKLQKVSKPYHDMARLIVEGNPSIDTPPLPRSAERTVALRKLLESKDAAVRAAL